MLGRILITAINAIVPIVLLILLGYVLKKKEFINDNFIKIGNKLMFNICLPCMLFVNVYDIGGISEINWDVVIYSVAVICLLAIIGFAVAIAVTPVPKRKGVLMQCAFRSNFAIIGMPLAEALGGSAGASVTAVVSAFSIPTINILAVIALTVFMEDNGQNKHQVSKVLKGIARNPLIIGVAAGLIALLVRELQVQILGDTVFKLSRDLKFLYTVLSNLKAITSPLAMIVLGGGFVFSAVKGLFKEIAVGTFVRLVLAPVLGLGGAILLSTYTDLLHCGPGEYATLIALFGSPVAVSSAVMAISMKNDEQLATQLVVWTSIGSILTIFLQVCILMAFGYL